MTRATTAALTVLAFALAGVAPAAIAAPAPGSAAAPEERGTNAVTAPPSLDRPPPGYSRPGTEVARTAGREPKVRAVRARRRDTYARPYLKGPPRLRRWQVSFYAPRARHGEGSEEIAQVIIDDRSGRAIEVWTGFKVAWTMARGYPGAFGRKANHPAIWIILSALFVLPFLRRPLRLLHLDLAVLLAFSISYALFGAGRIHASVPTAYPLLAYLLARMLGSAIARSRGRSPTDRPPLRLTVPYGFLVIAIVFLIGFRVGLNVTNANVIDVGYSGVIGADRLLEGRPVYGSFPSGNPHGDTYGPVTYYAYVPFVAAMPWSGRWDDLPAAHGAAVAFDLLCMLLMFLVGRRVRGPALGILLAYGWVTYPFTLLVSNSNANDSLVAALVLLVFLAIARPAARGVAVAVAGLTKFAPLALAPLVATYGGGPRAGEWGKAGVRPAVVTAAVALAAAVALMAPVLLQTSPARFYERTLSFQSDRGAPFSIWGLYDLQSAQHVVTALGAALAVALAFVPRRRDVVVVAALGAAVLLALQLGLGYWFYLYLVWCFPLVLLALLAPHAEPEPFPRIL